MKTYRYVVIDWNMKTQIKIAAVKYIKGLANVRKSCPVPLCFNRNAGAFLGFGEIGSGKEYWAIEC